MDLIPRLARLISQILDADYCQITLLDATKKYSVLKCIISGKNRFCTDERLKIVNRAEKMIIRTNSVIIRGKFMAAPLISSSENIRAYSLRIGNRRYVVAIELGGFRPDPKVLATVYRRESFETVLGRDALKIRNLPIVYQVSDITGKDYGQYATWELLEN